MRSIIRASIAVAVIATAGIPSTSVLADDVSDFYRASNLQTFGEVQERLGMVPAFFRLFPAAELAGMWDAYQNTHLNPNTALDAKTKQLIGLAVAAQAECSACIYFQASAAFASGASFKEVQETVAIMAIGNDWSDVLPEETFDVVKRDTDALVGRGVFDAAASN